VDRLALAQSRRRAAEANGNDNTVTVTVTATLTVGAPQLDAAIPVSPVDNAPRSPIDGPDESSAHRFDDADRAIIADEWCLEYLSAPYMSALTEALDDDASGYVRITEVNEFCRRIPKGWSLLQW
jgi:hypothetical protein